MTFVGYAHIGISDAGNAAQSEVLACAGCTRIFEDHGGPEKHFARPALAKALAYLRGGYVLLVCRLDRPGWSLSDLVETITDLAAQGIGFRALDGPVDTTGPNGALVLQTLHALVDLKREINLELTQGGLAAAIASGKRPGRPPTITPEKIQEAHALVDCGLSKAEASRRLGVSRAWLQRALHSASRKPGN